MAAIMVVVLSLGSVGQAALDYQFSVNPGVVHALPAVIDYSVTESDPTLDIANVYWDFGDGGRSLTATGQYTYVSPGIYTVSVGVEDTQGGWSHRTATVDVSDPAFPTLVITSPATDPTTTNSSTLALAGQTTSAASVSWSTDRGEAGQAAGAATFAASVPLHPGRNRILVNAYSAGGAMSRAERIVHDHPAAPMTLSNVVADASPTQRWEPFTIRFDIGNSWATNYDWPYETNPPEGVPAGLGITVNAEFSDDGFATVLTQPAFFNQPYSFQSIGGKDWLYPSGQASWSVRFAPPRIGAWQYRLTATDASGTATSAPAGFTVIAPTDPANHGFVRVNPRDSRYFAFDDGTDFLGVGHNENWTDPSQFITLMDNRFAMMGTDSAHFFRIWLSNDQIFGAAWAPLNSATLPYSGYLPATGLQPEQAYGDGIFSVRLNLANPCMFYGWMGGNFGLQTGRTYRIRVRVKLVGVAGPSRSGYAHGFTVKRTGWPDPPDFFPGSPAIIAHRTGSLDWAVLEGNYTASGTFMGNLSLIMENCTAGTVYIDEISIREVQTGGALGPEINHRSRMNYHTCFGQAGSYQYDHLLDQARQRGYYYRLVVTEKDDPIFNRIGKHGVPTKNSSATNFNAVPGTAGYTYQSYWWRYLTARWAAQRSLHSWELANEQDPWNATGYAHTQEMAAWIHSHDPHRHDSITSFWTDFPDTQFWKNPAYPEVKHADVHAYLFYGMPENTDTALAHWSLGRSLAAKHVGKPITRGEVGIVGSQGSEEPDLKRDTSGVWLHNLTWAMLDANGMFELYWFTPNIRGDNVGHGNLYDVYRAYRRFMADIPLGNGQYADAQATSSNPLVRVVGQVDRSSGRGHLWIQHANHTWRNVVDNVSISPASSAVGVPNLTGRARYRVTWFDTTTGLPLSEQEAVTTDAGAIELAVENLTGDVAVKLAVAQRLARSDFDLDGDVDLRDFGHFQACLSGRGVAQSDPACADARLDSDEDVDQDDYAAFQRCMSGESKTADPNCAN